MKIASLAFAAATIRSASATVAAIGFCRTTCLPAARAGTA